MNIKENLSHIKLQLPKNVTLVAVSKTKPVEDLWIAYDAGQRVFGENKIQEMTSKYEQMPKDIHWHMIGHVQSNKVKYMAPYVSLIHGVDRLKLLKEINKQALQNNRIINCLLQIKIASEDSKYGLSVDQVLTLIQSEAFLALKNIKVIGLMGMATFTNDQLQLQAEFDFLKSVYEKLKPFQCFNLTMETLSMGMSSDFILAIKSGSTMVRVGSRIFGKRNY